MDSGRVRHAKATGRGEAALLSVSQFAAREGVTRARVLQLLAARRLPGARRIGHHWAIPAASAIERRPAREAAQPPA